MQQFFPQLMVSLAVYPHEDAGQPGPGGIRFLDSATVGGTVPTMVTDTIQAAQRSLRKGSRVIGAGRDDYWEIEPEVIREAVVNALSTGTTARKRGAPRSKNRCLRAVVPGHSRKCECLNTPPCKR